MSIVKPNNNTISAITALPAAIPTGRILQVVTTTKTDAFNTNSSSYVDVTGLSAAITPSSTSNKILIVLNITGSNNTADRVFGFQLVRGSTAIALGGSSGSRSVGTVAGAVETKNTKMGSFSMNFVDTPSTTSATTYKVQTKCQGASDDVRVNSNGGDQNAAYNFRTVSTITLMEIAA